jgi:hypothetical protein
MSGGRKSRAAVEDRYRGAHDTGADLDGLTDPRFSCEETSFAVIAMSRRRQKGFVQQD